MESFFKNMSDSQREYLAKLSQSPYWTFTRSKDVKSCPMHVMFASAELGEYMKKFAHPVDTNIKACSLLLILL